MQPLWLLAWILVVSPVRAAVQAVFAHFMARPSFGVLAVN